MTYTLAHLRWPTLGVLACAGLLAACGSNPPANPALAASASSLEAARSAGAAEWAAVELNDARTKLERARALAQTGKNQEAIRMAEQADADAQLARAKAGSERSRRAVAEVEASLRTLREELARGPGGATAMPSTSPAMPNTPPAQPRPPQ
jgi:multidrug efflux pump subunit AcrA (membrane-fusion protein)